MAINPKESDKNTSENDSDEKKLLEEATARFDLASEAEAENRKLALDDLLFIAGEQWPENIKRERAQDGRPCLTINKLPQFIQQVTNDQRQNRPSIKVHPIDDAADVETAKTIQGLIRHIEYNCNSEIAYDTAFEYAVKAGFGYWRVVTQYESPTSFNQEILIKRINNPFSVYFDPHSSEPDGSDANFAFITEDLSKDEFKLQFPKAKLSAHGEWENSGNLAPSWMNGDTVRVAEYFYKENKDEEICLLSNGETILKSEFVEGVVGQDGQPITIQNERTTSIPKICWVKINGTEILEKREWPGMYIPIVPVYGAETNINGKRILSGIVRNAKDPARMYNFWASAETEAIALAPKAPYIAADGQIEPFKKDWETANRRNHAVLTYKPIASNGQPVPPPQRQAIDTSTSAITQARMLASDDIKATTGIYDAALGAKSNESSGVAIQRRNVQAQTSNFHFIDNLTRSLRHTGRILIDLIPKIYDTERTARIIGDNEDQKVVKINGVFKENGKQVLYALDTGKYDVTVDVGPSFQTKRQEAVASIIEMARSHPQLMQAAGDILAKNMDWPGSQEIADRLKKMLPPGLVDDDKAKQNQIPPQVQQQIQMQSQMVDKLSAEVHALTQEKEMKLIELQSKERIEMAKLENQATIELAKLQSKESIELLAHQIAELDQRTKSLGFNEQFSQPLDGSNDGAYVEGMNQNPTSGESLGLPMEGINHDNDQY